MLISTLGFPRIGPKRELKFALEKFWKSSGSADDVKALTTVARSVEESAWNIQAAASDKVTVGDLYLYDGVLSWVHWLGLFPQRFMNIRGLDRMFAMARGVDGATALSMKKWITSNYHYMVPEMDKTTKLSPDFTDFFESVQRGIEQLGPAKATPVLIGPVTIAYLTQYRVSGSLDDDRKYLLEQLLPIYESLIGQLSALGITEIQLHEASLVFEDSSLLPLYMATYPAVLSKKNSTTKINIVSFMEDVGTTHYKWLTSVKEFDIISMDFTRGDNLGLIQKYGFPEGKVLGAGLVDARSVWRVLPRATKPVLRILKNLVNKNIRIQPSASLQFVPWDLSCEKDIVNHPTGTVLAFAVQKLDELRIVAAAFENEATLDNLEESWNSYSKAVHGDTKVSDRMAKLTAKDFERAETFTSRRTKQLKGVPLLPTTTIGSFPQTKEIRYLRSQKKKGTISEEEYNAAIDRQIAYAIGVQEALGLDILVHGEAERTDMVEFFAHKMDGMLFTSNGWVQSFGSRCVRPPIFWSDISRPSPMTIREFKVAQSLTDKPVKGMLTGPVTILNWSFPRVDISRKEQCLQIALGIRDEIRDLEEAGCKVVQVDEPALREAMPLRSHGKKEYLEWAVDAFRLSTAGAKSETQIHTHMCYCEFNDCMDAIDKMDTDVNSIENARSDNATLVAFKRIGYNKGLGPGTYDIHSPVVPPIAFITDKLESFLQCVEIENLVVNPDCGLKTRTWPETVNALKNMVAATEQIRAKRGTVSK
ncbi:hypothetical protein ACA910_005864 [Epithemia clementina (nom. ined.)]